MSITPSSVGPLSNSGTDGREANTSCDLVKTERIYGALVPIDILYDQLIGGLKFASLRSRAHSEVVGHEMLTVASLALRVAGVALPAMTHVQLADAQRSVNKRPRPPKKQLPKQRKGAIPRTKSQ